MNYVWETFDSWILPRKLPFPCEIHAQWFKTSLNDCNNRYKVFINSTEPQPVCQPIEDVIKHHNKFDLILTKNLEILESCKNAKLFLFGSCSVDPLLPTSKKFEVSFLCTSNRGLLSGYELRHELWKRQNEIQIPKLFYSSRYRPVDLNRLLPEYTIKNKEKIHLFSSMFSICPENHSEINYFTEKLIDAIWTRTVPIYWGCPNIGDYFDERGIIKFHTISELIDICNKLTPDTYNNMLPYIEENWRRSFSYLNLFQRIENAIVSNFNSK